MGDFRILGWGRSEVVTCPVPLGPCSPLRQSPSATTWLMACDVSQRVKPLARGVYASNMDSTCAYPLQR